MALIHDLEEAITGDLTPQDRQRRGARTVLRLKSSAMAQILGGMPSQVRAEYQRLWKDLKIGRSREARLVKNLDRLEMALQAREYETRGARGEKLAEFYSSALREITDASLKRVVRGLVLSR
jgi:putative hydrolase of HD superfamily